VPCRYAGGCAGSANRTSCNCAGVRPPFGAPAHPIPVQEDPHFPAAEAAERASLATLVLISVSGTASASIRNVVTAQTATLAVGETKWGWELLHAGAGAAVVEHDFEQ